MLRRKVVSRLRIMLIEVEVNAKVHEEVAKTLMNEANFIVAEVIVVFRGMLVRGD